MERQIDFVRQLRFFRIVNQALLVSLLGAVLLAVFFYVLTAASPLLGEITWHTAAAFGAKWWLTALGGEILLGASTLSLMPLSFSLFIAAGIYFPLKKEKPNTWAEIVGITFAGVPLVALVGILSKAAGAWWIAIFGITIASLVLGVFAAQKESLFAQATHLTQSLRFLTVIFGKMPAFRKVFQAMLGSYLVACLLTVLGFAIFGTGKALQIQGLFHQGALGNIGIVLLQLLYLPLLFIWAGAWLLGSGVLLGTGSTASIIGSQITLLPAIPLLGLIPGPDFGQKWFILIPLIGFFSAGIISMQFLKKQLPALKDCLKTAICAALTALFTLEIITICATGGIGPERMAHFGPIVTYFVLAVFLVLLLPFVLGMVVAHPASLTQLRNGLLCLGKKLKNIRKNTRAAQNTPTESSSRAETDALEKVSVEKNKLLAGESEAVTDNEAAAENTPRAENALGNESTVSTAENPVLPEKPLTAAESAVEQNRTTAAAQLQEPKE